MGVFTIDLIIFLGCPPNYFDCQDSNIQSERCIWDAKICDGSRDCALGSDEDSTLCFQYNITQSLVSLLSQCKNGLGCETIKEGKCIQKNKSRKLERVAQDKKNHGFNP